MSVFAISDLHLAGSLNKSMDIFGEHWEGHWDRIRQDWNTKVSEDDLVLLPGDISWAMHLSDAIGDLLEIGELPGKKVMIKGNHDYWWSSITKLRAALHPSIFPMQNQAFAYENIVVCGSRGWVCDVENSLDSDDKKIYDREVGRLELSLIDAKKKMDRDSRLIAMMHYPPFNERHEESGFTKLFKEYGVEMVVYGHLHGHSLQNAFSGDLDGINYSLVSCDNLGFKLKQII